jgi:hypothetical protein
LILDASKGCCGSLAPPLPDSSTDKDLVKLFAKFKLARIDASDTGTFNAKDEREICKAEMARLKKWFEGAADQLAGNGWWR